MARRIWLVAKRTILAALVVLAVVISSALAYRAYRHRQIAQMTVIDPIKGIDEDLYARIGGIDQWISILGHNRDNPIVLMVHGGPGIATSPYPRTFLFNWTRDFTVVRWDQRGAGKTFGRSGAVRASVTIDRMAQDGVEVAEFVRAKLHKPKILVVGHSWGSSLGVRMARARPDLFYAYVGTGQSVNQGKFKAAAYEQLLAEARTRGDRRAMSELTAIGPPPYDSVSKAAVHTKWANAYEPGQVSRWGMVSLILFDSDAGPGDLRDYMRGIIESENAFRPQVDRDDLPSLGTEFAIPVFIFQGAKDDVTPAGPVREYFNQIVAPRKEFVLIPNAGHNALVTRSDEFLTLLRDRVKPLTSSP